MSNRTTFAVLGVSATKSIFLAKQIAKTNSVLLFDQKTATLLDVYTEIISENSEANAEMMICPTNASWEADIIILSNDVATDDILIEKIRKVATGKIVLFLAYESETFILEKTLGRVQQMFPFSKVVLSNETVDYFIDSFLLKGKEDEALKTILTLFTSIGLKVSI